MLMLHLLKKSEQVSTLSLKCLKQSKRDKIAGNAMYVEYVLKKFIFDISGYSLIAFI